MSLFREKKKKGQFHKYLCKQGSVYDRTNFISTTDKVYA